MSIYFSIQKCVLDYILVAMNQNHQVCAVLFGDSPEELTQEINLLFRNFIYSDENSALNNYINKIINILNHKDFSKINNINIEISGTEFQKLVWEELRKIPVGKLMSYSELACLINKPKAVRAVASACAKNKIALLIPCHRVIRASGELSEYRWGVKRKKAINFMGTIINN